VAGDAFELNAYKDAMRCVLVLVLVLGCKSDKEAQVVSEKRATVAAGSGSSKFQTDRSGACQAFADRVQPPVEVERVADVAKKCATDKRVTAANYDCLMAATSLAAIESCEKQAGSAAALDAAKCDAYAKHMLDILQAELHQSALGVCMSSRMTEQTYDCVMAGQSEADFKRCFGG
jgi:hypothetical protein